MAGAEVQIYESIPHSLINILQYIGLENEQLPPYFVQHS